MAPIASVTKAKVFWGYDVFRRRAWHDCGLARASILPSLVAYVRRTRQIREERSGARRPTRGVSPNLLLQRRRSARRLATMLQAAMVLCSQKLML